MLDKSSDMIKHRYQYQWAQGELYIIHVLEVMITQVPVPTYHNLVQKQYKQQLFLLKSTVSTLISPNVKKIKLIRQNGLKIFFRT